MVFVLTSGERHEAIAFDDLLRGGKVKRQGRGRPKSRFRYFLGDKAYSSQNIRTKLRVERLINRLKQNRRIATRYEKYAVNYLAMLTIGSILLWL